MHHHDTEGPPCRHMEKLLQQAADESSRGWRRWYALSHAARCFRCGNFLHRLREMRRHLAQAKQPMPEDVQARIAARLREAAEGER